MMWILFSVLSSTALMVIFKYFARFDVRVFPAIVVNYITCFICGNLILGEYHVVRPEIWQATWFLPMASLGIFFISAFYLMGTATRIAGASATSVAAKMSVVVPMLYSVLALHEKLPGWQVAGMLLSLFCVYLMRPESPEEHRKHSGLLLLILVFAGSGMVDTGLSMVKHAYGSEVDDYSMSTIIFGAAGCIGIVLMLLRLKTLRPGWKELAGGVVLGLTNYISLLAMFGAMGANKGNTAWFFAVNNIGVVACSSIISMIIFGEKVEKRGWLGLALSGVAIILMNLHAFF